jgi:hypothetical protein
MKERIELLKFVVFSATFFLVLIAANAQSIELITNSASSLSGTICPQITVQYSINSPAGCVPHWTPTNGQLTTPNDQGNVSVVWDDKPGATAALSVTFSGCTKSDNNKLTPTWSALILSVKDQPVPTYYNSLNIDFCAKKQSVHIQIPHVYVQGTGGIGEPPLQEVTYTWKLPSGWYHVNGGSGSTTVNFIDIYPNECAMPGNVIVQGSLVGLCSQAGFTAAATISLNGVRPTLVMGPQGGYAGAILGKTDPVTFTATVSPAIQCVNSYTWTYPRGWSYNGNQTYPAVTTSNTITLIPSGTDADAGPVSVAANLSCGNDLTTMPYTVPFVPPQVTGPGVVCTSGNFTVQNVAPGVSYAWSSGNTTGLNVVPSSAGNSTATFNAVPGFSGNVPVNVNVTFKSNTVTATSNPFVGMPSASIATLIYPSPSRGVNPIGLNAAATYYFRCDPVVGAASYNWILPSGFSFLNSNGNPATYITTTSVNGTYTLYCQAVNMCGAAYTNSLTINITGGVNPPNTGGGSTGGGGTGSGGGKKPPIAVMTAPPIKVNMYPNPTIHSFIVNVTDTTTNENPITEYEVHLFDQSSKEVMYIKSTDAQTHIPVDHLPPNVYYLVIQSKEGILREELLITN